MKIRPILLKINVFFVELLDMNFRPLDVVVDTMRSPMHRWRHYKYCSERLIPLATTGKWIYILYREELTLLL